MVGPVGSIASSLLFINPRNTERGQFDSLGSTNFLRNTVKYFEIKWNTYYSLIFAVFHRSLIMHNARVRQQRPMDARIRRIFAAFSSSNSCYFVCVHAASSRFPPMSNDINWDYVHVISKVTLKHPFDP